MYLVQSFSFAGKSGVGGSESHILVIVIIISVGAFIIIVVVVGAFLCTRRTTSHQKKYDTHTAFNLIDISAPFSTSLPSSIH